MVLVRSKKHEYFSKVNHTIMFYSKYYNCYLRNNRYNVLGNIIFEVEEGFVGS